MNTALSTSMRSKSVVVKSELRLTRWTRSETVRFEHPSTLARRRSPMRSLKVLPIAVAAALAVAPAAQAGGGGPLVSLVASGLDSPRHLAFGARGDLFVAEAGRGGPTAPCFVGGEGPGCWGPTGSVTKVDRWGRQSRIISG